jgi:histidinol-phosphate aminotransferase
VEELLRPDFSLDADPILNEKAKLTAICQPNNPTASLFDNGAVRRILRESAGIVMIDEAYAEFCGSNMIQDVMNSELAIDVRTFSKAYGIAGLRAGFAISRKEIVDEMRSFRTPFGLNAFTEAVAIRALDNKEWVIETVSKMKAERDYLSSRVRAMGFKTYPSDSNYLLCSVPGDGPQLVASLRAEGIAVRDCNSYPLLSNHIRITIGPRPMMDALLKKLEKLLEGGRS